MVGDARLWLVGDARLWLVVGAGWGGGGWLVVGHRLLLNCCLSVNPDLVVTR